jgi:transcription antitermination factor NusG
MQSAIGAKDWVFENAADVCPDSLGEDSSHLPATVDAKLCSMPMMDAQTGERHAEVNWYALYTWPRHEKSVAEQIKQRRISCFLPLYRSVRRWKDRRKELDLALFPGYVFVRIAPRDRLRVLQLTGAVRFVSFNGHPAPLPDGEIEALMNALASGVRAQPHPYLTVGRRVRIRYGPLARSQGILLRRKDRFRVVLSLDLLRRSVDVEVDESDVEPC